MRGPKIDSILSDRNTWPFSGPGGSSQGIETGDLQETAVRTLWDPSRDPKPPNLGQKSKNCRVTGLK